MNSFTLDAVETTPAERVARDQLWQASHDLVGVLGEDGVLCAVNPAWRRLLGHGEATWLGRKLLDFVDPAARERAEPALDRLRRGEKLAEIELPLLCLDGGRAIIAWRGEMQGGRALLFGHDVTAQREAEDRLRQAQKMAAVGQITGGIAHDFNNLLQGVSGSLDLVERRLKQGRSDDIARFIVGAASGAKRAAALIQRLLAFSQRQPLDPRPIAVNALIGSMAALLQRSLGENVALELKLAEAAWPVRCDGNQLETALLGLVLRAREAVEGGGRVTITTENAELRAGAYLCIAVEGTGSGPASALPPDGVVGLATVHGFAQQAEGFVETDAAVTRLYLPRGLAAKTAAAAPARLAAPGGTVLVIEDEPMVRAVVREVLQDIGYATIEAGDGPSGLDILLSGRHVDLLLTDIGLSGLDGREVARAAREQRPELKIIFMTGYAEAAPSRLPQGMAMIAKPFDVDALVATIHAVMRADG